MKIDTSIGFDPKEISQKASLAEELGYDGIWSTETSHDPFIPLALAAQSTERLDLGTSIAVAFARNPMNLAVLANDLQTLSKGRFILGLGSQIKAHITKRYSMPWSHPAPRMRELILAIRAIWSSWGSNTKLDFRGEYYTHTLMTPFFDPGPNPYGNPKIVLAAVGPQMTEVAGEVADGVIVHPFTTKRYLSEMTIPALERGAAKAGKDRSQLQVSYPGLVVTWDPDDLAGKSPEEDQAVMAATQAVKAQIAFYGSTPAYRGVLELHGWGDLGSELNALSKRGEWATMGSLITDEMLDTFAVVAPSDSLGPKVLDRFAGLVDRFSFYTPYTLKPTLWPDLISGFKHA